MKKDKIILFDLDGTLIDSDEAILESFAISYQKHNTKIPCVDRIKEQIGYPLDIMYKTLGICHTMIDSYVKEYKEHYRMISCRKTKLLPRAKEAVELAYEHALLGIVTTKTGLYSIELLEYMGLMDYFDVLIGRENVSFPKPNAEPIQNALKQLPKVASGYWMIGDTCLDIQAATNANIKSIAVLSGYGTYEQLSKCTSNIVDSTYDAVLQIITK